MSGGIELDFRVPLGRFTLTLAWKTTDPSLGLFGPSGAGKTTALEAIAGLRRDAEGLVRVNGETWLDTARGVRLPPEERGVGYVPQDTLLFPHRDVMGNLTAGRRRADRAGARLLSAEKVVEVLELGELKSRAITTLSGGERQRVALGRALCSGPGLLLLDEPLASLDLPLRRRILPYLLRVRREFGVPTIHVSHDPGEIQVLAREVTVLAAGRVVRQGRPDDLFIDPQVFPMREGGEIENLFRGTIVEIAHGAATVEVEPGVRITVSADAGETGESVIVTVRPEDLILAVDPPTGLSAQNVIPAIIHELREAGTGPGSPAQVLVALRVGRSDERIVATVTTKARDQLALAAGRRVHLIFKAQACRMLPG